MKELIRNSFFMIRYYEKSNTLVFRDFVFDITITQVTNQVNNEILKIK
jgi:hypothetical protein